MRGHATITFFEFAVCLLQEVFRSESTEEPKRPLVARMRTLRYKVRFGGAMRLCAEQTGQGISPDRLRKSHRSVLAALSVNSAMAFPRR